MSLISTSSTTNQEAFLFENHYPQPIVIQPNSQICLQKFIHYRANQYEVDSQSDIIGFRFGSGSAATPGQLDKARFARIPQGSYSASLLAEAVTTALNSVNQQQNYLWECIYVAPADPSDLDVFEISYTSVTTPTVNAGQYNSFTDPLVTITNQGSDNEEAKIQYGGGAANSEANVLSKRSILVKDGQQTWNMIQPDLSNEDFYPLNIGLTRALNSNPDNENPNLAFDTSLMDLQISFNGTEIGVFYGKQTQGSPVGNPGWFNLTQVRKLDGLFDPLFKPGGTFSPHTKLQIKWSIYASSQSQRRVLIQWFKKEAGETTYTPLADGFGGNSTENGKPFVKTTTIGGDTFAGLVYDSNDPDLNDSDTKINTHYPKLSVAPFFATTVFAKQGNIVPSEYDLDSDTWTNAAGIVTSTFTPLVGNTNGYTYRITTNGGNVLLNTYWLQIDPLTFQIKGGDVPMTIPPLYNATLDPTVGNGQIVVRDGTTGATIQTINFDGGSPVALLTENMSLFTQGIFNPIEPVASLAGGTSDELASEGVAAGGLGADLNSNARLFVRGSATPTGVSANVGNLLGFTDDEPEFNGGGSGSTGTVQSDFEPDKTANNNTLHIAIPEMPLVKSFEGENSAEAKSIAIIPREEFSTGDNAGSLVYIAPFENWIDINNGQELNLNLLTTIVRNADGTLADNLIPESQAVFKIRQDPMKIEEDKKEQRFKEMAEMMANTINTGLTSLITPQQLIGS